MDDDNNNKSPCIDYDRDIELFGEQDLYPILENEFDNAKSFLKKPSAYTGDNLYDHLSDVLNKLLTERPENVIDFFEDYSRKVKEIRYRDASNHLRDIYISLPEVKLQKSLKNLLTPSAKIHEEIEEEEEDSNNIFIDPMENLFHFEQMGVGIPRHEMFILGLSLRKLLDSEPLKFLKFWGKIFGIEADYYVAEGILNETGITQLQEEEDEEEQEKEEKDEIEEEEEEGYKKSKIPRKKPPVPKPQKIKKIIIPREKYGTGANKRIYYVCHRPGVDKWIRLPDVVPEQIQIARQITKYFTGNLNQPIESWPTFPGVEKNYLRAQICRITGGTEVAPLGMFSFTADAEEDEAIGDEENEDGIKTEIYPNKNYAPVSLRDLDDGTFSFWVHTALNILPQGRCTWWNPQENKEEEAVAEEEDTGGKIEKETGPPLLNPCSEDVSLETIPPWTVRIFSKLTSDKVFATIRSNLWPGSYSFTVKQKIGFIYFGTGHKHNAYNYNPSPLPPIMNEYPIGPEIMEILDPSGAEEKAWIIAHEQKPYGEGEEEEEEQTDDDEDD